MANRYSIATGLASAVGTWDGGASVPVEGDRVLICAGHTVTLDGTYTWGDDSTSTITINGVSTTNSITVAGTLKHSRSVSSSLTAKGSVQINSGGVYDQGTNADPITSSYTADLLLNKSASLAASKYGFRCINGGAVKHYGMFRKRVTTLTSAASAGATSITVALATGWQIGDEIFLPVTSSTDDQYEFATIAGTYTPGSTTVPLTAALSYAHANSCPVGNMSSNVSVKPYDNTYPTGYNITFGTSTGAGVMEIGNALFRMGGSFSSGWGAGFVINANSNFTSTPFNNPFAYIESNAFLSKTSSAAVHCHSISQATRYPFNDCAYISTGGNGLNENGFTQHTRGLIFGAALQSGDNNYNFSDGGSFVDGWVAVRNSAFPNVSGVCKSAQYNGTKFLGPSYANCYNAAAGNGGVLDFTNCDISETFSRIAEPVVKAPVFGSAMKVTMTNCYTGSLTSMTGQKNIGATSFFKHINKNRDVTNQEEWYRDGTILRDNSEKRRSTSSMKMLPSTAATPFTRSFTVAVSSGETIRLVGYCKYDSTYYNGGTGFVAPTMTISGTINGVTLTPVTYTATSANAGNWELIDKSITNTSGADGELTVTFSIQSAVTTGYVYWDGIVVPPMVVRARHYGYLFDEANPKRVVNPTVSASEATAAYYTGMSVTWGTSSSTISITADNTFQKLYDYTQAQGCLNVASAMPITGAGVAGNPVLFAQGNVTITTGDKLNGAGSLSMGAFTLTTEFATAGAYTYTGGTWSQATTIPSFGGGTVNIGAAGTYEFDTTGTVIVNMTPTGAGTYAMEDVTANGVLDLRNATAHNIIVELSTATAALAITSNSPGPGTITVTAPTVTADISITSMPNDAAGTTRLQIFNSTARDAAAWAANTVYATGAIVRRSTGIGSESTAGLYFRATAGGTSHATTEPTWNTTPGSTTTDGGVTWTCYKVLYYDDDPASTSYTDAYIDGEEFKAGEVIVIRFAEMNGSTSFKTYATEVVATAAGFSALVAEEADSVYATFAIDGSTQDATFSPNFTSDYIVLDSNTDFSGKGAFAYYCYVLTTSQGMYEFWGGVTGIDPGNIRINTDVLNLYFDESSGFVKQTDDVRIFRSDGTRPALDPTTGGNGIEINWRTPVSVVSTGGSALTPTESATLMALPSAATVATAVWSKGLPL